VDGSILHTRPRPVVTSHRTSIDRQREHIGRGGMRRRPHDAHVCTSSSPRAAAEELGLSGEIATEDFRAVLRGLRPASEDVLVHRANGYDDRRAGWDATFNAPKSVSIQGLVGDDHRLIEAHGKAVSRALLELEQYALSRRRGGSEWVVTGNVVDYTRTFEVKELSVPVDKAADLKKFYRIIASDERNTVVLKPSP